MNAIHRNAVLVTGEYLLKHVDMVIADADDGVAASQVDDAMLCVTHSQNGHSSSRRRDASSVYSTIIAVISDTSFMLRTYVIMSMYVCTRFNV